MEKTTAVRSKEMPAPDERERVMQALAEEYGVKNIQEDPKEKAKLYSQLAADTSKHVNILADKLADDAMRNADKASMKNVYREHILKQIQELQAESEDVAKVLEQKGTFTKLWEGLKGAGNWTVEKVKSALKNRWVQAAIVLAVAGVLVYFGWGYLAMAGQAIKETRAYAAVNQWLQPTSATHAFNQPHGLSGPGAPETGIPGGIASAPASPLPPESIPNFDNIPRVPQ